MPLIMIPIWIRVSGPIFRVENILKRLTGTVKEETFEKVASKIF